jgi:hypothetical protein
VCKKKYTSQFWWARGRVRVRVRVVIDFVILSVFGCWLFVLHNASQKQHPNTQVTLSFAFVLDKE